MTNVVDNMVDLVKNIANLGSNNYPRFENVQNNKQLDFNFFQISDIIPYMDSVRRITHIKSSDDLSDSFDNESDIFSPKKELKDQRTEDFFAKVHLILNKGKESNKLSNDNRNKMQVNNFYYLKKDDLIDIFDDTNYNEKKFYKNPEKNFRREKKNVPKHLVPFWDNRTIVDCDKKHNYSYDSNTKPIFVQLKKKQDFQWKEKRKSYQNNQNKNHVPHNVLICNCSSTSNNLFQTSQAFNIQLKLSENFEIISIESRSKSLINQNLHKKKRKNKKDEIIENNLNQNDSISKKSHQNDSILKKSHQNDSISKKLHQSNSIHKNNTLNKKEHQNDSAQKNLSHKNNSLNKNEHQNNSNQKESHQNDSAQIKSHQKNLSHKNNSLNKNEHQNDSNKIEKQKNSKNIDNDIQHKETNKVNKIVKQIKKHKMKDPLIQFEDSIESCNIFEAIQTPNQHHNKNELCFDEEEEEEEEEEGESENEKQNQYQIYKYRNVKKMKINTKHVLSDEIDPILDKLSSDDENEEEIKANKLQVDPIISNEFDQNIQDPNLYFKNHQRNKKFDELCSFDISEVPNKMFHRRRNPIIKNPNEFDIIEYDSDIF